MKRIYQLRDLLDIVIWGTIILSGLVALGLLITAISGNNIEFKVLGEEPQEFTVYIGIATLLVATGYVFFFLALFKLKNLVSHFVRKEFFIQKTVSLLKNIGRDLLISVALIYVPTYIYKTLFAGKLNFQIGTISPDSFFFLIVMGLFFLTLGYIFQEAKKMKEENELTV